ncbi:MAG: hypothetical protein M3O82_04695 [Verrucomicrobiota bacterium]|nr:hypothetical protein [Verrucomicrobiota bacterium]
MEGRYATATRDDQRYRSEKSGGRGETDTWLYLSLCERDLAAASRAAAALPPSGMFTDGINFPRTFCNGLVARLSGDIPMAQKAFEDARTEVEAVVRAQPDYGPPICVLGMIDAALGRKEDAIREGKRAVELLPVDRDAINGIHIMKHLAVTYAWSGEKDRAIDQIMTTLRLPTDLSYGQLKLHPFWDALRDDQRFEKIVADLAPKAGSP